ncbi:MAG: S8 family serine peptidase [Limnobacter sp.]|nr:S8 family serine peptidase [Limnobacter sp.]
MQQDWSKTQRGNQSKILGAASLVAIMLGLPVQATAQHAPPQKAIPSASVSKQWLLGIGDSAQSPQQELKLLQSVVNAVQLRSGGQWRVKQALLQPGTYLLEAPALLKSNLLTDIDVAQLISGVPGVVFSHPNYILKHAQQAVVPSDSEFASRQSEYLGAGTYAALNMPKAWGFARGSADQVIAVLDSGVLYGHPELKGRLLPGYDFVTLASPKTGSPEAGVIASAGSNDGDGRDADPSDPGDAPPQGSVCPGSMQAESSFHGTAVASMAVAQAFNGGMVGVDWNVKVLPVRVTARCGVATVADIVDAVYWAIGANRSGSNIPSNPNPATVINLSLAAEAGLFQRCPAASSDSLLTAFAEARRRNIPVVASAGNSGGRLGFPAACPGVIAAGAVTSAGEYASYSSRGRQSNSLTISAPGDSEGFFLAAGNSGFTDAGRFGQPNPNGHNLRMIQGTSFSAPMVAGVLSLMRSIQPSARVEDLERILGQTAKPLASQSQESCGQPGLLGLFGGGNSCQCVNGVCGPGVIQPVPAIQALLAAQGGPLVNVAHSRVYTGNPVVAVDSLAQGAGGSGPLIYKWEQVKGFPVGLSGVSETAVRVVSGLSNNVVELKLTVSDAQTNQSRSNVVRLVASEVNEQTFSSQVSGVGDGGDSPRAAVSASEGVESSSGPSADAGQLSATSSGGGGGGSLDWIGLVGMVMLLRVLGSQSK